ncbi:MAG: c-type cytochrome, partial [Bacteroidetes bacterium]|nr:c-type cytochrome [Bacteroidota bacterium]
MMISLQRLISRLSIALLFVFSVSVANAAEDKANGEKLFKANCTSCHELGKKKVGPDLTGVLSRWKDTKKLHAFIHDPTPFLKSDPYVKGLMEKMNGAVMS